SDHRHEYYAYVWWLIQEESPLLILGLVGATAALRGGSRFAIFASLYAGGLIAAYSLIPYKTPWLALNMIVPLAIVSGYAVDVLSGRVMKTQPRAVLATSVLAAFALSAYQMLVLNYVNYDDGRYPYVYAQTDRDVNRLMREIAQTGNRDGSALEESIAVTAEEYWPLPFYLRDYKHVGYFAGTKAKLGKSAREHLVLCSEDQEPEIGATLGSGYERVDSYTLRPGLRLVLYRSSSLERIQAEQ